MRDDLISNEQVPLMWVNGDERPWKEIVDDQERAGWVVDLDVLLQGGWRVARHGRRLGRDKNGRVFMLCDPVADFKYYLEEVFYSAEAAEQVVDDLAHRIDFHFDDVVSQAQILASEEAFSSDDGE